MSKERELLNRCAVTLKARGICPLLLAEITELLRDGDLLYTSPPRREPLSEDEIVALWANKSPANEFECVRLVEKAHGIGGGE